MLLDNDVVVTGIGVVSSLGHSCSDYWDGLKEGRSGAGMITRFDTTGFKSHVAAEVKDFDPSVRLGRKRVKRMALFSQYGSYSALEAIENAGIDLEKEDLSRIGCSFGTAAGDYDNLEKQFGLLATKGPGKGEPMAVPKIIPNMSSANIGIDLGIHGPNLGLITACSSSSHSIGMAALIIQSGQADVMVAGGSESTITPLVVDSYGCMGVLTGRNDDPTAASRPFDRDREGFLIGEGGASLILESAAHAKARGAEILAVYRGFGMTSDAYSIAIPEPGGKWASEAILASLKQGKINLDQVGYINAHGTSTKANDFTETVAIRKAFGSHADKLAVSSIKSMIGHNLGAAGALEAAATVLSLYHGVIPPTINYENPDPDCDLDYVPNQAREAKLDVAISNSFGFGGQNGVLAFQKMK